jgi:hypothetical protein
LPCGSIRTLFIGERSIISPPSQTALPDTFVAAAAHGYQQAVSSSEINRFDHISDPDAAGDNRGPIIDHRVVDLARCIVSVIAPNQMAAAQAGTELLDRVCVEHDLATRRRRDFDIRHRASSFGVLIGMTAEVASFRQRRPYKVISWCRMSRVPASHRSSDGREIAAAAVTGSGRAPQ